MTPIKRLFAVIAASSIVLSSCQKNVISEPQSELLTEHTSNAVAADSEPETAPPSWTSVVTNVNANVAGFWQGVPAKYSQTTKNYPLIVFIHGIGELGTTISRMNCCGIPNHMYNKTFPAQFTVGGANYSFLVIAPQFKVRPSAADVQSVINYAKSRWRVDGTRIYVTGLSMGGGSTWDWSAVYGQNAAAIVPVCGGTRPTTTLTQQIASKNLPIWGLYSTLDAAVPVQWGRDFFTWIDQYNTTYAPKTKLTIWTDVDHNNTWARAFNPKTVVDGYNIYQWMLLHTRGGTAAPAPTPAPTPTPEPEPTPTPTPTPGNALPVAKAGGDQVVPASWNWFPELNGNPSSDSDGWIAKYAWAQISGPACTITPVVAGRAKVTGWTAGTYVFRLTVTDNKGGTATDEVQITISSSGSTTPSEPSAPSAPTTGNLPPVAKSQADMSVPASWNWFPELNGNLSKDPDGWITKYTWTKVSGPACTVTAVASGRAKVTGWTAGAYVFRITVTDNKGATGYHDLKITVTNN
jgi:dienelactone hydrolase